MPVQNPVMPDDKFNRAIQGHSPTTTVNLGFTGTTSNLEIPTESRILRLHATQTCFYRLGTDNTVTVSSSNGVPLPAGAVELPVAVQGFTHIAVIRESTDGIFYITKMI